MLLLQYFSALKPKKQFILWAGNPSHTETKTAVVQNRIYLLSQHHRNTPSEKNSTITNVHKKEKQKNN